MGLLKNVENIPVLQSPTPPLCDEKDKSPQCLLSEDEVVSASQASPIFPRVPEVVCHNGSLSDDAISGVCQNESLPPNADAYQAVRIVIASPSLPVPGF